MRNSYCVNDTRVETGPLAEACPADEKGWTEWWEVGWLSTYLSSKADAQGGETPMEFYQKFIDSEHKKRDSVNILFSQGARFAVSRETILRRTKEEYAKILATLAVSEDPYAGYYMEWMWSELFNGHLETCDLPAPLEASQSAASHQDAMDRVMYRYAKGTNGQLLPASETPAVLP